jgi:hypothetical protein
MLPESHTAVIARNETWRGTAACEGYEAGWAREAVIFIRALKSPTGPVARGHIEISADGMHWLAEGTTFDFPASKDEVVAARLSHFGNWLRVRADLEDGAETTILITAHLKA